MAKTILALSMLIGTACGADDVALPQPAPQSTTTEPMPPTTTVTEPPTTATAPEPEPVVEEPTTVPTTRARSAPTTAVYVAPRPVTTVPARSGGGDGAWVIPTYIVMCESGGNWNAENASGAGGPYQLMPEHFGGESALNQSRAAQHAKAAELWNGGRGASNWAACL